MSRYCRKPLRNKTEAATLLYINGGGHVGDEPGEHEELWQPAEQEAMHEEQDEMEDTDRLFFLSITFCNQ